MVLFKKRGLPPTDQLAGFGGPMPFIGQTHDLMPLNQDDAASLHLISKNPPDISLI